VDDELECWWGETLREVNATGMRVVTARDGEEAWDQVRQRPWDLVVTDQTMPGLSGLELIRRMRGAGMRVPVVFVSSALPLHLLREEADLGIDCLLEKPVAPGELLEVMRGLVAGRECPECRGVD
jgi:DNA-binding response OmpR family regulator